MILNKMLTLYDLIPSLTTLNKKKNAFGNIQGEGENAGSQQFLLFPPRFQKPSFGQEIIGKGLNQLHTENSFGLHFVFSVFVHKFRSFSLAKRYIFTPLLQIFSRHLFQTVHNLVIYIVFFHL